jgi:hypothetical protein
VVQPGFLVLPASAACVCVFAFPAWLSWLSTVSPTTGLVAVMFDVRHMAMRLCIVFFSHRVGAFAGVWPGGRLHDLYGTYDVVGWRARCRLSPPRRGTRRVVSDRRRCPPRPEHGRASHTERGERKYRKG